MATEAMRRKCAEATRVMAAHDDDHVEDDDDDHHVEDDDDAFFMNPHAEEAHGGNDEDDDDDDDDDDGEIYFIGKRAVKRSRRPPSHGSRSRRLKSAASASHAVRQNLRSLLQGTTS